MTREVVFFESLFKSNLWIWGLGWLFHASLALVLLRHLRYFTEPVWGWVAFVQPFGMYAGITMLLGLADCGRAACSSSASATFPRLPIT